MSLGDFKASAIIDLHFSTRKNGLMISLVAGAVAIYKGNGTTPITAGITLATDINGVTGLNAIRVDTSADPAYTIGSEYAITLAAGTLGGVPVAGATLDDFSLVHGGAAVDAAAVRAAGALEASVQAALTAIGAPAVTVSDDLAALSTLVSDLPTPADIADGVLARNLAGGSDGGRTVQDALRSSRNKVTINPTTGAGVCYCEDDTTIAFTFQATRAAVNALVGIDPA